jgi:peptide-methionine (R)-S-oxide reductase
MRAKAYTAGRPGALAAIALFAMLSCARNGAGRAASDGDAESAAPPAEPAARAATTTEDAMSGSKPSDPEVGKLEKPKSEWQRLLEPDRYRVLFEEGTERAGSSPLNHEKREGTFICAACNLPLFTSDAKFESGTGWPSFFKPIPGHVEFSTDYKLGYARTEYHCARCGGHQGHVFDDGPAPTGQRWCNNGVAIQFVPKGEALPELRP